MTGLKEAYICIDKHRYYLYVRRFNYKLKFEKGGRENLIYERNAGKGNMLINKYVQYILKNTYSGDIHPYRRQVMSICLSIPVNRSIIQLS